MNRGFEDLTAQLQEGTRTASAAGQRAAATALSNAQKNAEKLVAQVKEQQQASEEKFNKEIGAVKSVTDEHTAKVTGLETTVGSVKENVGTVEKEVAANKSTLDQTINDLKSARGDLGVQSGLIATNAKELAALRDLGERTYYEFTLQKGKAPVKVANMVMTYKKVDTKRNKYNVEIMADDKRIEKKDKTVNEPVQMYVGGNRQPYEIVVNEVKKDTIVGYVAVPKVLRAAR
jgi:septal ring factor EnvC (AmiA/AmiB activator)